jgi:hypothetical protein
MKSHENLAFAALKAITVTGGRLDIGTLMTVPANGLPASIAPAMQAVVGTGGRVDLWKRVRPEIGLSASSCKMLAVVGQFGIFG